LFYLAEYCPRAAPAQILSGESERKKEGRKERKLIYMYQGMWIRCEEKCPGCLKVSKEEERERKGSQKLKMSSSKPQVGKEGGRRENRKDRSKRLG